MWAIRTISIPTASAKSVNALGSGHSERPTRNRSNISGPCMARSKSKAGAARVRFAHAESGFNHTEFHCKGSQVQGRIAKFHLAQGHHRGRRSRDIQPGVSPAGCGPLRLGRQLHLQSIQQSRVACFAVPNIRRSAQMTGREAQQRIERGFDVQRVIHSRPGIASESLSLIQATVSGLTRRSP